MMKGFDSTAAFADSPPHIFKATSKSNKVIVKNLSVRKQFIEKLFGK